MAKRRIETKIEIEAPAARVWEILTDFDRTPSWNPFITSISGVLSPGARLSLHVAPPGRSAMRFRPVVLTVRPERELRWLGSVMVRGVFDGEHFFLLEPLGDDHTRLTHGEEFSGFLVGPMSGMLAATQAGFVEMNKALKKVAEGKTCS